ncbi:MAG: YHYH protein [Bacteroidota bacterium]
MKKLKVILGIVLIGILTGCHSHKMHSHDDHPTIETTAANHQEGYFGPYTLNDKKYGTNTVVTIKGDQRTMVTNALPNHDTGTFPNQGNPNTIRAQKRTYVFPVNPKYTGVAKWAREPGVALNGVKFEPQTAEVVACESGENYRVEAIQNLIDLGLDFNHAHVQPTGAYHYHGTPTSVVEAFDEGKDLVHIGFALDGFPIYYSKSGAYKPSYQLIDNTRTGTDCTYENPKVKIEMELHGTEQDGTYLSDWEYIKGLGDLDECNGITVSGQYMYLVTDDYPYVGRCLMGEFKETERRGPPPGRRPGHGPPTGRHPRN